MTHCRICLAPNAHWTCRGLHVCEECSSLLEDVGFHTEEHAVIECSKCDESLCGCDDCREQHDCEPLPDWRAEAKASTAHLFRLERTV